MKTIIANWKMKLDKDKSIELLRRYTAIKLDNTELIISPSPVFIGEVAKYGNKKVKIYSQDVSKFSGYGSYTGEISAKQLDDLNVLGSIVGHSERRYKIGESDEEINKKIINLLEEGLEVCLCIGEQIEHKENKTSQEFLESQIENCLKDIPKDRLSYLTIAYEPVWAISSSGSGEKADGEYILNISRIINNKLEKTFSNQAIKSIKLLYGGSVNSENIREFDNEFLDGFIIGSASLDINEFKSILQILENDK